MNLNDAFLSLVDYFSSKNIDEANVQYIKVEKIKEQEMSWHNNVANNKIDRRAMLLLPKKLYNARLKTYCLSFMFPFVNSFD